MWRWMGIGNAMTKRDLLREISTCIEEYGVGEL
jgi:hypothetical protein